MAVVAEEQWHVAEEWARGPGRPFFQSDTAWDWFVRHHRAELTERGVYIPGKGRRRSIVGPGIVEVIVEIISR